MGEFLANNLRRNDGTERCHNCRQKMGWGELRQIDPLYTAYCQECVRVDHKMTDWVHKSWCPAAEDCRD